MPRKSSYIASWLQVLKNDSRGVFSAVVDAQGAVDYLHRLQPELSRLSPTAGGKMSLGMTEFERNLALFRVYDVKHAETHPKNPCLEVEDAMVADFGKEWHPIPDSFFTYANDFKPKHSSEEKKWLLEVPSACPPFRRSALGVRLRHLASARLSEPA